MIYFSADPHFFHANILKMTTCPRPWANVSKMNRALVSNWNQVVKKADTAYILGDITMDRKAHKPLVDIIHSMNGHKHLILGNHDQLKPFDYLEVGFESVHTSLDITYKGHKIFMCHDPTWSNLVPKDYIVACGHSHGLFKIQKNCINVGVDVWEYFPISIDKVIEEMS